MGHMLDWRRCLDPQLKAILCYAGDDAREKRGCLPRVGRYYYRYYLAGGVPETVAYCTGDVKHAKKNETKKQAVLAKIFVYFSRGVLLLQLRKVDNGANTQVALGSAGTPLTPL